MNRPIRFTEEMVAKRYCDDPDEAAAPEGGGSFAEYAPISHREFREVVPICLVYDIGQYVTR